MKSRNITIIVFILLSIFPQLGFAQDSTAEEGPMIFYFTGKDQQQKEVAGYFYETRGPMFQDPDIPKFILASRKKNVMMGIGGYVLLKISQDFNGVTPFDQFYPYDILPKSVDRSRVRFTANASRLFFKLIATDLPVGRLEAYVEGDFQGADRTFLLRQAYVKFAGFTFGQAVSTFVNPSGFVPTVDQDGSPLSTLRLNPLVRYEMDLNRHLRFGVGVEMPPYSATYSEFTSRALPRVPDFPFYFQVNSPDKENLLRLSIILRSLSYRNDVKEDFQSTFGVGAKLGFTYRPISKLKLISHGLFGKGISSYTQELEGKGLDLLPNPADPGTMFAPQVALYYAGMTYNFTPTVYSSASYAYHRLYTTASFRNSLEGDFAQFYKYGQSFSASLFWDCFDSMTVGMEYLYGRRKSYDGTNNSANRIYAMIRYNF